MKVWDGSQWVRADAGKVLQVVSNTTGSQTNSSTVSTWLSVGLSATITPTSSSNKILILSHNTVRTSGGGQAAFTIFRDATNLGDSTVGLQWAVSAGGELTTARSIAYLDSPATTSAITYSANVRQEQSGFITSNRSGAVSSIVLMEIAG